jgi:hypothetical protein
MKRAATSDYLNQGPDLIEKIRKGDRDAYARLYDKYSLPLMSYFNRQVNGNEEAAELLLQQVFVLAWQEIGKFDASRGRFFSWLFQLAKIVTLSYKSENPQNRIANNSVSNNGSNTESSALALILLNGCSISAAAKKLNISADELKLKLRMDINKYRADKKNGPQ